MEEEEEPKRGRPGIWRAEGPGQGAAEGELSGVWPRSGGLRDLARKDCPATVTAHWPGWRSEAVTWDTRLNQ